MGMPSIKEVYRIGRGPSSSHTMGPEKAALYMLKQYPDADLYKVVLMGSLAKTGKGHGTDFVIKQTFAPKPCEIEWDYSDKELPHPNTLEIAAFKDGNQTGKEVFLSVGGGALEIAGQPLIGASEVYKETTFNEIADICKQENITLSDYVFRCEPDAGEYLSAVWKQMQETIQKGITVEGELPGGLHVQRRAKQLYELACKERDLFKKEHFFISAFAYASSEENASGGRMVTAPTCGACGVLPAALYYEKMFYGCSNKEIENALAAAGIIGLLIKTNASVSGAEAGCQAEIGSACSMTAAAMGSLKQQSIDIIEAAAEIAMEHCLGLTCDPVGGLVQIPCIERNAVGVLRSYDAATLAEVVYENRKVSFDTIVKTMYETGRDLSKCYRETSEGGLAKLYVNKPR